MGFADGLQLLVSPDVRPVEEDLGNARLFGPTTQPVNHFGVLVYIDLKLESLHLCFKLLTHRFHAMYPVPTSRYGIDLSLKRALAARQ